MKNWKKIFKNVLTGEDKIRFEKRTFFHFRHEYTNALLKYKERAYSNKYRYMHTNLKKNIKNESTVNSD